MLAGVEAKILNQFPADTCPVQPARVREVIGYVGMTAAKAIERLCEATGNALGGAARLKPQAAVW